MSMLLNGRDFVHLVLHLMLYMRKLIFTCSILHTQILVTSMGFGSSLL